MQRVQSLIPPKPSVRVDPETLNRAIVTGGRVPRGTVPRLMAVPDPIAASRQQKYLEILDEVVGGHLAATPICGHHSGLRR